MVHYYFARWVLAVLLFGGFSLANVQAQPPVPADYCKNLEQETFGLINQYRTANKFPALKWSDEIAVVARGHSKDMATGEVDFGHEGFGKRVSVLKTEMTELKGAGENVLKTDNPDQVAQAAVQLWLHSPHHLANIRGDFNYSGMGIWRDDSGVIYFTQFFVKIVPPVAQPAQATAPAPVLTSPMIYLANPSTR